MSKKKFTEAHVPEDIIVQVRYLKHRQWQTVCRLIDRDNGAILCMASATCSNRDHPVRKIGRAIAVGRALKEYYGGVRQ